MIDKDVDFNALAERLKSLCANDVEAVFQVASGNALVRHVDLAKLGRVLDVQDIRIAMRDFNAAIAEFSLIKAS